jgi:preprotein translocase YajC subunit
MGTFSGILINLAGPDTALPVGLLSDWRKSVVLSPASLILAAPIWVLAQDSGDPANVNPLVAWLPFILVGVALYFLAIRPQKKRAQELRSFQSNLEVGDEVRTAGGIIGVISSLSEKEAIVEVGGVKLKFARGAIAARAESDAE